MTKLMRLSWDEQRALIEKMQGGDPDATAQLWELTRQHLMQTLASRLQNRDDLEDVVQTTLVAIMRLLDEGRVPVERYSVWAHVVGRNNARTFLSAEQRLQAHCSSYDAFPDIAVIDACCYLDSRVEDREASEKAMQRLDVIPRAVASLLLDGYSCGEIAQALDTTAEQVQRIVEHPDDNYDAPELRQRAKALLDPATRPARLESVKQDEPVAPLLPPTPLRLWPGKRAQGKINQLSAEVRQAIEQLPDESKRRILLKQLHGMAIVEIAKQEGMTRSQANAILIDAKEQLQAIVWSGGTYTPPLAPNRRNRAQRVDRLLPYLDQLSPKHREVMQLWCEGKRYREIADELQIEEDQLRHRISYATHRLRKLAAGWLPPMRKPRVKKAESVESHEQRRKERTAGLTPDHEAAILMMTRTQRDTYALYLQGYTHTQIAAKLSLNLHSIGPRIHKAKQVAARYAAQIQEGRSLFPCLLPGPATLLRSSDPSPSLSTQRGPFAPARAADTMAVAAAA